ncbi:hypothetical protein P7K49_020639, partial [Saguinus oedipus]
DWAVARISASSAPPDTSFRSPGPSWWGSVPIVLRLLRARGSLAPRALLRAAPLRTVL